ncbi:MAG TPA: T9SS type A sorting domain-containing protein [Chitinophagales bacterium]|nr:T9SS type A sorting domain-containing protein [Chitinophagales bacterium]
MKKLHYYLLILFCALVALPALAQNTLRIEIVPTGTDSFAVIKNGSVPFTLRMHNDSLTDYIGVFDFNYTIDSAGAGSPIQYTDTNGTSGLNYFIVTDTIFGQDSVDIGITVNAGEPRFKSGPSVVVIWPIRSNGDIAGNQLSFVVNVLDPAGVEEAGETKLRAFRWENNLLIQRQAGVQLNRLRIFDILGREILNKQNPADTTSLPLDNHGVYIAEITYNNNIRKVFRFYY